MIVVFDAIPVHQLSAADEYLDVLSVSCPRLDESRRSFHMLNCNVASDPLCPSRIAVTAIAGPRVSEWVIAVSIGTVLGGGLFGCLILPSPFTFFFGCWVAAIGSLPVFGGFTVVAWLLRGGAAFAVGSADIGGVVRFLCRTPVHTGFLCQWHHRCCDRCRLCLVCCADR